MENNSLVKYQNAKSLAQDETLGILVDQWNLALDEAKTLVEEQNKSLKEQYHKGEIGHRTLLEGLEDPPRPLQKPSLPWVYNFLRRFGWSLLSSSSEQASLGYSHPDMKLYRQHVEKMMGEGVHPHLILNFDQVWRCAFQWNGKMHWKARDLVGKTCSKSRVPKKLDKKRHAVRGARKSLTVPRPNFGVVDPETTKRDIA